METTTPSASRSALTDGFRRSSGGYELVFAAVILGCIGFVLDRRLGWTPILTVALSIFGFAGAVVSLWARYKAEIARLDAETTALRAAANRGGSA